MYDSAASLRAPSELYVPPASGLESFMLLATSLARNLLKGPNSELTYFSRPLRTPPEASGQKTELTADVAAAPANRSALHVSRRWRKCGRPLPSRRHPGASHRGDGSPLRGRRGACTTPHEHAIAATLKNYSQYIKLVVVQVVQIIKIVVVPVERRVDLHAVHRHWCSFRILNKSAVLVVQLVALLFFDLSSIITGSISIVDEDVFLD